MIFYKVFQSFSLSVRPSRVVRRAGSVRPSSTQRKSTREGFFGGLRKFAGYFWKSFPCENSYKNHKTTRKKQEKTKKNQEKRIFAYFSLFFLCLDPCLGLHTVACTSPEVQDAHSSRASLHPILQCCGRAKPQAPCRTADFPHHRVGRACRHHSLQPRR